MPRKRVREDKKWIPSEACCLRYCKQGSQPWSIHMDWSYHPPSKDALCLHPPQMKSTNQSFCQTHTKGRENLVQKWTGKKPPSLPSFMLSNSATQSFWRHQHPKFRQAFWGISSLTSSPSLKRERKDKKCIWSEKIPTPAFLNWTVCQEESGPWCSGLFFSPSPERGSMPSYHPNWSSTRYVTSD